MLGYLASQTVMTEHLVPSLHAGLIAQGVRAFYERGPYPPASII
jgi:hypothetical protein